MKYYLIGDENDDRISFVRSIEDDTNIKVYDVLEDSFYYYKDNVMIQDTKNSINKKFREAFDGKNLWKYEIYMKRIRNSDYETPYVYRDDIRYKTLHRDGKTLTVVDVGDGKSFYFDHDSIPGITLVHFLKDRFYYGIYRPECECIDLYVRYYDSSESILLLERVMLYEVVHGDVYCIVNLSDRNTGNRLVRIRHDRNGLLDYETVYELRSDEEYVYFIDYDEHSKMLYFSSDLKDGYTRYYIYDTGKNKFVYDFTLFLGDIFTITGEYGFVNSDKVYKFRLEDLIRYGIHSVLVDKNIISLDLERYDDLSFSEIVLNGKVYLLLIVKYEHRFYLYLFDLDSNIYHLIDKFENVLDVHIHTFDCENKHVIVRVYYLNYHEFRYYDMSNIPDVVYLKSDFISLVNTKYDVRDYVFDVYKHENIPYVVIRNKHIKRPEGLYVSVYGSYGLDDISDISLSDEEYYMLDHGLYVAYIYPRGSGVYDLQWWKDGAGTNKFVSIQDSMKVLEHLMKEYGDNVILHGSSAGAVIVFHLCNSIQNIKGVVFESGLFDLLDDYIYNRSSSVNVLEFGDMSDVNKYYELKKLSPYHCEIREDFPDTLIFAGYKDLRVLVDQPVRFYRKLKKSSKNKVYMYICDGDHSLVSSEEEMNYMKMTKLSFIFSCLKS